MSMRRDFHCWTNHELRQLRSLAAAGLTRAEAAAAMGLPLSVVQHGGRNYAVHFVHPLTAKNLSVRPDGGACVQAMAGVDTGDCRA
jgi:hypothetical protein